MVKARFAWDTKKDSENQEKHGVSFAEGQFAFADPIAYSRKITPTVPLKNGISVLAGLARAS